MSDESYQERFGGVVRSYGVAGAEALRRAHFCVVGIGGVGSWAAEGLARSGVGAITLIDHDTISASNTNRQLHTLSSTLGGSKVAVMAERIAGINPACRVTQVEVQLTEENLARLLAEGVDMVIDAIDAIRDKAALIYHCKRNKIPIVTTGGAGGLTDPSRVEVIDLSRTSNDPLAAKVRHRLRSHHGFSRNPQRRFGIDCVYSLEQHRYPKADGSVGQQKPGVSGLSLDCHSGYGSVVMVTACFGLVAAARGVDKVIARAANRGDE